MSDFIEALHSDRVVLMDGAMGTELQTLGLAPGAACEEWNVLFPERVGSVHRAYAAAGAEVLLTNTFMATREGLERRDCRTSPALVAATAVEVARQHGKWVLGDLGPFQDENSFTVDDGWEYGCGDVVAAFAECDGILLETLADTQPIGRVLKQLTKSARQQTPILASATYHRHRSGIRTFMALTPEEWVRKVEKLTSVVAIGINCGREIGMKECIEIVHRYRDATYLPVFVRPNAGTPKFRNERWVYPHSPEYMASWLPELQQAGVCMVGGCCGTTPAHIAEFKKVIDEWNARVTPPPLLPQPR
jgi:methionine synthase I (cobalamin-dependent)